VGFKKQPKQARDQQGLRYELATLYTIGHSTRTLPELIAALQAHSIETLVDIRSFPMSRRLPHFNRESLESALPAAGIRYLWMKALGGYRKKIRDDSPNVALRNVSFRNYADHMLTPEFEGAIWGSNRDPLTCARSGCGFIVIACWYRIGWWHMDTRCCT
jgi:hypothetical protein